MQHVCTWIVRAVLTGTLVTLSLFMIPPRVVSADDWQDHAPLPTPVSNNAVTTHVIDDTCFVYTFLGIDETKIWSGLTQYAARLNTVTDQWEELPPVPGAVGRIAAAAATVKDEIFVIGGYSVSQAGGETTWASVDIFDPLTKTWSAGTDVPIRVDDMVHGVWRDSLIYLVSGWSQNRNVRNVQIYNPADDTWQQSALFPGPATFGAAGGVVGDQIVVVDGVNNAFNLINSVWLGDIDPNDPTVITWQFLGTHPGNAGYRMGYGVLAGVSDQVFFSGGTDNAYNFNGIGYNGQPSNPTTKTWAVYTPTGQFIDYCDKPIPTMDHRGFVECDERLFVVGGMEQDQLVTTRVSSYRPDVVTAVGQSAVPARDFIRVVPNPASESVGLVRDSAGESGSNESPVVLQIFDVKGRQVRRFQVPSTDPVRWDLRDSSAERVQSGVYWLRMILPEGEVTARVNVLDPVR